MPTFWSRCRRSITRPHSYVKQLRLSLAKEFPGVTFAFLPSDMVTQILNFGLPAPIDIQVIGNDLEGNRAWADQLLQKIRYVPGTVDLRIQQPFDDPYLHLRIERTKAQELGFSAHDIAQNLLVSLSGSFQTSPTFWLDPRNGVSYSIATQTPQYRAASIQDLVNTPVTGTNPSAPPSLMASLVSMQRGSGMAVVSHYNVAPVIDIFGSVDGRDLGGVSRDINKIIDCIAEATAPRIAGRGSRPGADDAFVLYRPSDRSGVRDPAGLSADRREFPVLARSFHHDLRIAGGVGWNRVVSVHNAHNSQRPGADGNDHVHGRCHRKQHSGGELCHANRWSEGKDPITAALQAGFTRFRPVLMTALAMIIGMVPMALGLGDGGEQNAPLGRAVIGGLLFATVSTLLLRSNLLQPAARMAAARLHCPKHSNRENQYD